jgi:gliding motility-associated-like protein
MVFNSLNENGTKLSPRMEPNIVWQLLNLKSTDMYKRLLPVLFFQLFLANTGLSQVGTDEKLSNHIDQFQNAGIHNCYFEENKGQLLYQETNHQTRVFFKARTGNIIYYITNKGITVEVYDPASIKFNDDHSEKTSDHLSEEGSDHEHMSSYSIDWSRFDINLIDGKIDSSGIVKEERAEFTSDFYYSHIPQGVTNVRYFKRLTFKNVYDKIDWIIYFTDNNLKFDFIVHPGGNPDNIQLGYLTEKKTYLNEEGDLCIPFDFGVFLDKAPITTINGKTIPSKYKLTSNNHPYGNYSILSFDIDLNTELRNQVLCIDPELTWSTFFGGNDPGGFFRSVKTTSNGQVYATGYTRSTGTTCPIFNLGGGAYFNGTRSGGSDFLICRFSNNGNLLWSTYYGGNATSGDEGHAVGVDSQNNLYVLGCVQQAGTNIPVLNLSGAYNQPTYGGAVGGSGGLDLFLIKFSPTGVRLWATFFGGSGGEDNPSIAFDQNDNFYLTFYTTSTNFPTVPPPAGGYYQSVLNGTGDAVVAKFNSNCALQWCTYLGGDGYDSGRSIAITNNKLFLLGSANISGNNFPIVSNGLGFSYPHSGNSDMFFARLNLDGVIEWSSFYGSSGFENAGSISAASTGELFFLGRTNGTPPLQSNSVGYFQSILGGSNDFLIGKISNDGVMIWSSLLGGSGDENFSGSGERLSSVDNCDNFYFTGYSNGNLPTGTSCGFDDNLISGNNDLVFYKFSPTGQLLWDSYFGGAGLDDASSITFDANNNFFSAGRWNLQPIGLPNNSASYPLLNPGGGAHFQGTIPAPAGSSGYICKFRPIVPSYTSSQVNPNSCALNNGSATVTILCAEPPYTYTWSTGSVTTNVFSTTNIVTGLTPGTYWVEVRSGCNERDTINFTLLNASNALIPSFTVSNATCTVPTGSVTITGVINGTAPYSVTEGATIVATGGTLPLVISPVSVGTHVYTITDGNGCSSLVSVNVANTSSTINVSTTSPVTIGCAIGSSVLLNASSTTPGVSFSWTGPTIISGANTSTPNVGQSGTYVVTASLGSCTATASVTVNTGTPPTLALTSVSPLCNGASTGSVNVTANGGQAGYQVSWTGTQSGNPAGTEISASGGNYSITNLPAGNYNVTVSDQLGCNTTQNINITEPSPLTTNTTATASTCNLNNAQVVINASGGTSGYNVSWTGTSSGNPAGTEITASGGNYTVTNLAPGNYTFTITDANACTSVQTVTITATPLPVVSVNIINQVNCFGGNNGQIQINPGSIGFTYDVNPIGPGSNPSSQTSNTFTGLSAGNYQAVVTDNNGCVSSVNFSITQPTQLTLSGTVNAATCNASCNGSVSLNASGGTSPYTYSSNGFAFSASSTFTGLCAGTYNFVVQDNNGCLVNQNLTVNQPSAIANTNTINNPTCAGVCNGSVQFTSISGGTAPYTLSTNNGNVSGNNINAMCSGNYLITITDNNGCTQNITGNLSNPSANTIALVAQTPSDCGFPNGSLTVLASGAIATGFQYQINGGGFSGSATFNNLSSSCYTIDAQDNFGCATTGIFCVSDVQISSSIASQTNVTCFGSCDGTASFNAIGGVGALTYTITNQGGTVVGSQNTPNFSNLCAGIYGVEITDQGLCQSALSFTITEPSAVTFQTTSSNINCFGGNNGSINIINAAGGTGALSYSLNGGAFGVNPNFTGLSSGTYTIAVRDQNGCTTTSSVTLTEPNALQLIINANDPTCFGLSTGSILANGNGGVSPYQYNINGGTFNVLPAFLNLSAGNYTIGISDQNGCTGNQNVQLVNPPDLALAASAIDPLCFGQSNGQIVSSATGGTGNLTFSLNGGVSQNNGLFTGLPDGNYTVNVSDGNGCAESISLTLQDPLPISIVNTIVSEICTNSNGSIDITISNATAPYAVSWSNGQTTEDLSALNSGNYTVIITDNNNCSATANYTVPNTGALSNLQLTSTNDYCNLGDGAINITQLSGVSFPLQINYNGNVTTSNSLPLNLPNLSATTYNLIFTDANGCLIDTTISLSNTPAFTATISTTNVLCNGGNNGSALYNTNGGFAPFTENWITNSASGNNLVAGNYSLLLQDNLGCQVIQTFSITEPNALVVNISGDSSICAGASSILTANVNGGTPGYTFVWSNGSTNASSTFNAPQGTQTYTLIVTDNNNCVQLINGNLTDVALPNPNFTGTYQLTCLNPQLQVAPNLSPGNYTFNWQGPGILGNPGDSAININEAGIYVVNVTDVLTGCANTSSMVVSGFTNFSIVAYGDTSLVYGNSSNIWVIGANAGDALQWSGNSVACNTCDTTLVTPTVSGLYIVNVTNQDGCTASDTVYIQVVYECPENESKINIANVFSPNGDGQNDELFMETASLEKFSLRIFSRWGQMVFETDDPNIKWDGNFNGTPLNSGVYVYYLEATCFGGQEYFKEGNITLIR